MYLHPFFLLNIQVHCAAIDDIPNTNFNNAIYRNDSLPTSVTPEYQTESVTCPDKTNWLREWIFCSAGKHVCVKYDNGFSRYGAGLSRNSFRKEI